MLTNKHTVSLYKRFGSRLLVFELHVGDSLGLSVPVGRNPGLFYLAKLDSIIKIIRFIILGNEIFLNISIIYVFEYVLEGFVVGGEGQAGDKQLILFQIHGILELVEAEVD
jgi:hypothetical protein